MIKFQFTLSDVDAENLIELINSAKVRVLSDAMDYILESDEKSAEMCHRHADYLDELKGKVLNGHERVE